MKGFQDSDWFNVLLAPPPLQGWWTGPKINKIALLVNSLCNTFKLDKFKPQKSGLVIRLSTFILHPERNSNMTIHKGQIQRSAFVYNSLLSLAICFNRKIKIYFLNFIIRYLLVFYYLYSWISWACFAHHKLRPLKAFLKACSVWRTHFCPSGARTI